MDDPTMTDDDIESRRDVLRKSYDLSDETERLGAEAAPLGANETDAFIANWRREHPKPPQPQAQRLSGVDTRAGFNALFDQRYDERSEPRDEVLFRFFAWEREWTLDAVGEAIAPLREEIAVLKRQLDEARAKVKRKRPRNADQEIVAWRIDQEHYTVTPVGKSGGALATLPLRPLFEIYRFETRD
jgi:hypothetical protein